MSPQKQVPYMIPVSDQFIPVGCFKEPFVAMSHFKEKLAADKRNFVNSIKSEQLSQQLQSMDLATAPQQPTP